MAKQNSNSRTRSNQGALYLGEPALLSGSHTFATGQVEVRSLRSPDKDTANEDSAVVIPLKDDTLVLAVADGVGGAKAGREASNIAVTVLQERLNASGLPERGLRATILDALEEANAAVMALNLGAATTLVVAEICLNEVRSYHVGDSEVLSVGQRGRLKLQVTPHSPTGFAVEAGILDADEALHHIERHVLSNVIGAEDMRIEVGTAIRLAPRDTVLLASDGLLDNLRLDETIEVIRKGPLALAADRLVEFAAERMASTDPSDPSKPDDLTIVLYRPAR